MSRNGLELSLIGLGLVLDLSKRLLLSRFVEASGLGELSSNPWSNGAAAIELTNKLPQKQRLFVKTFDIVSIAAWVGLSFLVFQDFRHK